jgi:hypothetical protein
MERSVGYGDINNSNHNRQNYGSGSESFSR